jgi:hypothetical protein
MSAEAHLKPRPRRPHSELATALALNQSRKCKVSSCSLPRYNLNQWCRRHARHQDLWGNPVHGRSWIKGTVDRYKPAAEDFLRRYPDHEGLLHAIQYLDDLLASSAARVARGPLDDIPGPQNFYDLRALSHLHAHGITGKDLLLVVLACTFHLNTLPLHEADYNVFSNNLGAMSLRLAPKLGTGRALARFYRPLGYLLFTSLRKLIVSVVVHLRAMDRAAKEHEEKLS